MDFTTLVFLVVAVIIFWRLRSVLGSRTGFERSLMERKWPVMVKEVKKPEQWLDKERKILAMPQLESPGENRLEGISSGSPLAAALKAISAADTNFNVPHFLQGAKVAYELIVTAFAKGERDKLQLLLAAEIFANFEKEISEREKRNEKVEFHFVGITRAEITKAELKNDIAQIGVLFWAKLVQATRNAKGEVIEGDAVTINEVSDSWTFERKVSATDPNWKLAEVEDA